MLYLHEIGISFLAIFTVAVSRKWFVRNFRRSFAALFVVASYSPPKFNCLILCDYVL